MSTVTRRGLLRSTGVATLVGLAGCTGGGGEDTPADNGSANGQDGSSGPIKIGVLAPFDYPQGTNIVQATELAVKQTNADGGVLGREVELLTRDTKLENQTAVSEARRLINQDKVDFLMGCYASENTLAVQNQVAGGGPVYINTGSASSRMAQRVKQSYDEYKYFFKSNLSSPLYMSALADFFEQVLVPQTDYRKGFLMTDDLTYNKSWKSELQRLLPEIDMELVREIRFAPDTSDFSPLFSQAENSDADFIIPGIAAGNAAAFVTQWAEQRVQLPLYGVIGQARSDDFVKQTDSKCLSVLTNRQGVNAPITENTQRWYESFVAEYDSSPTGLAFTTWDGIMALFQAIEDAGTTDDDEVVNSMESLSYTGVGGVLDYQGPDDRFPHDPVYGIDMYAQSFVQWQENEDGSLYQAILSPSKWAGADGDQSLLEPAWLS